MMGRIGGRGALPCATLGLLLFCSGQVWAQTPAKPRAPDPVRGRELAEKLCVGCHRIAPEHTGPGVADVPSFPEIANRPGRTADRIMGAIMLPHPPMPDIALSNPALKDLAAYILTYKKAD